VDLQKACEYLEELSDKAARDVKLLTTKEFLAVQKVLLELQANGSYVMSEEYMEGL
jgi:hypothetical protein